MSKSAKRVPGYDYLYQRGARYLVRVQVPRDVREQIGKSEFKLSLGGDFTVAKRAYHQAVGGFVGQIEAARRRQASPGLTPHAASYVPSRDDIEKAAYAHFQKMVKNMRGRVAHPVGDVPGRRDNRAEGYRTMIEQQIDVIDSEAWSSMTAQASWLCEEEGWDVDEESEAFEYLCKMLLRARLQSYRDELRRMEGRVWSDPDADPLFGATPPKPREQSRNLGDLIDKFNATRQGSWSASTKKNYIIITRVLEEICGRETLVSDVDDDFCRNVLNMLQKLPANYVKHPMTKGRPISEAIEIATEHALPTISPATVRSHLNKLGAIVRFGRDKGWIVGNPMANIDVHDPVHPSEKRDPFSTVQLQTIFASDPWNNDAPTPSAQYPSRYWVPLIALFTGARLTDICGQRVEDMIEEDGIRIFHFLHRPGIRHIKGGRSRKVPVHPMLIELGFWRYVEAARRTKQEHLFADVKRDKLGKWGDGTSKWFSRKIKKLGLTGRNLTLHSFRHSFEDALRRADLHDTPIGNAITGRSSPGVSKNYGSKYPVTKLHDAMMQVTYPGFTFFKDRGVIGKA